MTAPRLLVRPWVAPLAVLTVAFLAFSLPPYLGLDPSQTRLAIPEGYPWYYPDARHAALAFSIVANRPWSILCLAVFSRMRSPAAQGTRRRWRRRSAWRRG